MVAENNMFRYILRANGSMAVAIRSEMNYLEFAEYIRSNSSRLHKHSNDRIFRLGTQEFINPEVMSPNDFAEFCPYII